MDSIKNLEPKEFFKNKKIAFLPTWGGGFPAEIVAPEVDQTIRSAIQRVLVEAGGAHVDTVDKIEGMLTNPQLNKLIMVHWMCKLGSIPNIQQYKQLLDKGLQLVLEEGASITGSQFAEAMALRGVLGQVIHTFMKVNGYDLLITPTVARVALDALSSDVDWMRDAPGFDTQMPAWAVETQANCLGCFTYICNLTKQPASTVPAGFSPTSHLPIGLQIIGAIHDDVTVLQASYAFEQLQWASRPVPRVVLVDGSKVDSKYLQEISTSSSLRFIDSLPQVLPLALSNRSARHISPSTLFAGAPVAEAAEAEDDLALKFWTVGLEKLVAFGEGLLIDVNALSQQLSALEKGQEASIARTTGLLRSNLDQSFPLWLQQYISRARSLPAADPSFKFVDWTTSSSDEIAQNLISL